MTQIKLYLFTFIGLCFTGLVVFIKVLTSQKSALEKEVQLREKETEDLLKAVDECTQVDKLRDAAYEIEYKNATTNSDDVFSKLHKYQRD